MNDSILSVSVGCVNKQLIYVYNFAYLAEKISCHHFSFANSKVICKCQHNQASQVLSDKGKPLGVSSTVTRGRLQGDCGVPFCKSFFSICGTAYKCQNSLSGSDMQSSAQVLSVVSFFGGFVWCYCAVFEATVLGSVSNSDNNQLIQVFVFQTLTTLAGDIFSNSKMRAGLL